jgi:ketosteroid isomerase-like protein
VAETETAARSTEETARAYFDAVTRRDVEGMAACWAPDGVDYLYGMADLQGPAGVKEWFSSLFRAAPDFTFEVTDIVTEGDKSTVRWRAAGTFDGEGKFEGMLPMGSTVELEGIDMVTVKDGLLTENRAYTNGMEMARQMGAMPPAGSVAERGMLGALNLKTRAAGLLKRDS